MPQLLWCVCSVHLSPSRPSLRVIKDLLKKDPTLKDRTVLPVEDIILLLEFCLKNTHFSFQDQFYVGHPVSETESESLLERLSSLQDMQSPRNQKEVKQLLGLAGYYRKLMPRFADISRPLTSRTMKGVVLLNGQRCHYDFNLLKQYLSEGPILKYSDLEKPYTLFTDVNKYAWACVLTQAYTPVIDAKEKTFLQPREDPSWSGWLNGESKVVHISEVEYNLPVDRVIAKLPDYQSFGRQFKLRLGPQ